MPWIGYGRECFLGTRTPRAVYRGSVRFSRPVSGAFTVSGPAPCGCRSVYRTERGPVFDHRREARREAVVYVQHRKTTAQCRLDRMAHRTVIMLSRLHFMPAPLCREPAHPITCPPRALAVESCDQV